MRGHLKAAAASYTQVMKPAVLFCPSQSLVWKRSLARPIQREGQGSVGLMGKQASCWGKGEFCWKYPWGSLQLL